MKKRIVVIAGLDRFRNYLKNLKTKHKIFFFRNIARFVPTKTHPPLIKIFILKIIMYIFVY